MVSIATRFIGPTNYRGSRYKAWVPEDVGRPDTKVRQITLSANHRLDLEANHYRVARALITQLGWFRDEPGETYARWYGGGTREGYVFVCALDYAELKPEEK